MKKPITDVKVDKPEDCPLRTSDMEVGDHCNAIGVIDDETRCEDGRIPGWCPLRQHSIRVNIGSKGLASVDGRVKG